MTRPMPEWLSGRGDIAPTNNPESWNVEPTFLETRSETKTDIANRTMRAPIGDTESARAFRLRELTRARISPIDLSTVVEALENFSPQLVASAEEFRVTQQLRATHGELVEHIVEGNEKVLGLRLAQAGAPAWNDAVSMCVALAGTKSVNQFITGYRNGDENGAELLRMLATELKKFGDENRHRHSWSSTRLVEVYSSPSADGDESHEKTFEIVEGSAFVTRDICSIAQPFIDARLSSIVDGEGDADNAEFSEIEQEELREMLKGSKSSGRAVFAPIVPNFPQRVRQSRGMLGRSRIASNVGVNPRHISRLLTDPERRVFDRKVRGKGGVVLIDISGSMRLDTEDIEQMLEHAPSATVYAYSDACRGIPAQKPNLWLLAKDGRIVSSETLDDIGNGGNGCDGTALKYAQKARRKGEPFVWVCDGYVTSAYGDMGSKNLAMECLSFVHKYGVHMVENTTQAIDALKRRARGETLPTQAVAQLRYDAS